MLLRLEGIVTLADGEDSPSYLLSNSEFEPSFSQLIDLRAVTKFQVTTEEIRSLTNVTVFDQGVRRAIVAPSDLSFGLARMYQSFAIDLGHEIEVFRDFYAACEWLRISPECIEKIEKGR